MTEYFSVTPFATYEIFTGWPTTGLPLRSWSSNSTEANSTANTVLYNDASSSSGSDSTYSQDNPNQEYVANLYYDEALGVYYDDFGTIHGGEYDGDEIALLRANSTQLRYPDGYSDLE